MIDTELMLGPNEVTIDNVQYWSRHAKELAASQRSKALKFVKYDCIKYVGKAFDTNPELSELHSRYPEAVHIFVCGPLNPEETFEFFGLTLNKNPYERHYNSSEYIIFKRFDNTFECNCQGWQTLAKNGSIVVEGANCAHVLALYFCFKIKRFGLGHGAEEQHLLPDLEMID